MRRHYTTWYEHKSKWYEVHTTSFSDKMIVWREKGVGLKIRIYWTITFQIDYLLKLSIFVDKIKHQNNSLHANFHIIINQNEHNF